VHFAATVGGSPQAGTGTALWIGFGLAVGGALIAVGLYALGGARPETPDVDAFISGDGPAFYSPPLLARLRPHAGAARAPGPRPAEEPARP
jgi:hypothetical protein